MIHVRHTDLGRIAEEHTSRLLDWITERIDCAIMLMVDMRPEAPHPSGLTLQSHLLHTLSRGPATALLRKCYPVPSGIASQKLIAHVLENIPPQPSFASNAGVIHTLLQNVRNNLKDLLRSRPDVLEQLDHDLGLTYKGMGWEEEAKGLLEFIFDYEAWTEPGEWATTTLKWGPQDLIRRIGLRTCPYCNRAYIYSVSRRKGNVEVRADLDHFFDKAEHPLLGLSFYNLVPSCTTCNSRLKARTPFTLDQYMHPYVEGFDDDAVFRVGKHASALDPQQLLEDPESIGVHIENRVDAANPKRAKINSHIELFCLEKFYKGHCDVVADAIVRYRMYTPELVRALISSFGRGVLTEKYVRRVLWGNYTDIEDLHRRPLAKLTRDVLNDLGFTWKD